MTITLNKEKNGIELRFAGKPDDEIREAMKKNGFRWSVKQQMWYAHMTDERIAFAQSLESGVVTTESEKTNTEKYDLWALTREDSIGNRYDSKLTNKEIAALCRKHLKPRFPMVNMSINTNGWNSVNLYINSSPFAKDSDELKAILAYCTAYVESFNKCICYDPYGDYGSSYNFYGSEEITYSYQQTETTEEIERICADFQTAKAEYEREEAIHEQERIEKMMEEQRLAAEESERIREKRESDHEKVMAGTTGKDVDYFVENLVDFRCNKCDRIEDYKEDDSGDECMKPSLHDCRVCHEIHMNDEAYSLFCNMLLDDWSFIAGTGGSATDDERVNHIMDYENMTADERKTVHFYSDNCVAVFHNDKLMFVVDAQGYNYCRYVYMVGSKTEAKMFKVSVSSHENAENNETAKQVMQYADMIVQDNGCKIDASENQDAVIQMIESLGRLFNVGVIQAIPGERADLKTAMYRAMQKMSGVQYQFGKANLKAGQRVTLVKIGDFGGLSPYHTTINRVSNTVYAQYADVVRVDHRPERKHRDYYSYIYGDCLVYDGWLPEIPDEVLYNVVSESGSYVMKQSKFMSFDNAQYDAVMDYYKGLGYEPIANTYNPYRNN